jgi:hypothetical protein
MERRYFLKLLAGTVAAATAKLSLANTESSSRRHGRIDNVRFIESPNSVNAADLNWQEPKYFMKVHQDKADDMRNDPHFVHVSRYANYYPIDCEVGNVSFKPPMRRIKRNS